MYLNKIKRERKPVGIVCTPDAKVWIEIFGFFLIVKELRRKERKKIQ